MYLSVWHAYVLVDAISRRLPVPGSTFQTLSPSLPHSYVDPPKGQQVDWLIGIEIYKIPPPPPTVSILPLCMIPSALSSTHCSIHFLRGKAACHGALGQADSPCRMNVPDDKATCYHQRVTQHYLFSFRTQRGVWRLTLRLSYVHINHVGVLQYMNATLSYASVGSDQTWSPGKWDLRFRLECGLWPIVL